MERRFTAEYARLYSKAALALFQTIEIFNFRVTARVVSRAPSAVATDGASSGAASNGRVRDVYWPGHGHRSTRVFSGALHPGERVEGPAIMELRHTSVGVAPGQHLRADREGTLILVLSATSAEREE
jgi:N-methylhydantoinase A